MTIEIVLTKGLVALIDDCDAHLAGLKWHALKSRGTHYAHRSGARDPETGKQHRSALHRVVLGAGDGDIVDHLNGDGLDNRRANLRLSDASANMMNRGAARRDSASGIVGVTFHKTNRRWMAHMRVRGFVHHLGYFDTPEEANIARLTAEKRIVGIQPRRLAAFEAAGLA